MAGASKKSQPNEIKMAENVSDPLNESNEEEALSRRSRRKSPRRAAGADFILIESECVEGRAEGGRGDG